MNQITLGLNNEIEHFELHNYHKKITAKADNEIATKELEKKVAELKTPAVHEVHQYAETSHKQQNNPTVNPNNEKVAARVKSDYEAIKVDDNLSLEAKEVKSHELRQAMKKQMTDAAKRTPEPTQQTTATDNTPTWPPKQ
jgi:hypothetical protein